MAERVVGFCMVLTLLALVAFMAAINLQQSPTMQSPWQTWGFQQQQKPAIHSPVTDNVPERRLLAEL